MFSKLAASVITLSYLWGTSQASALERRQDYCVNPVIVHISTYEVSYPVFINTYIPADTIINIDGGVTVNINNAPTYISTVVTATVNSTVYSTVVATITTTDYPTSATGTSSETTTALGPTAVPINFAIVPAALKKRQSSSSNASYVGAEGQLVEGCAQATTFYLQDGELLSGNGEIISTDYNVSSSPFVASTIPGAITTDFSLSGNILLWANDAFPNGVATFCLLGSIVEAVFGTTLPTGCSIQLLAAVPKSDCGASSTVSSLPVSTGVSTLPDGSVTTFLSTEYPSPTGEPQSITTTLPNGIETTITGPSAGVTVTVTDSNGDIITVTLPPVTETTTASGVTEISTQTTVLVSTQTLPGTVTTITGADQTVTLGDGSFITIVGPTSTITLPPTTETTSISVIETQTQTVTTDIAAASLSAQDTFVIGFNSASGTKHKRATQYLMFENDTSTLTDSIDDGALFSAGDQRLFSAGRNVGLSLSDISAGFAPLRLYTGEPDVSKSFNVTQGGTFDFTPSSNDGTSLGFTSTYCHAADGTIYLHYSASSIPFSCPALVVDIVVVATNGSQAPSSSSSTTSSATSEYTVTPPFTTTEVSTLPDGSVTTIVSTGSGTTISPATTSAQTTSVASATTVVSTLPNGEVTTFVSTYPTGTPTGSETTSTPTGEPTTTSTFDPSGDLGVEPTSTALPLRARSLEKKSGLVNDLKRRGGMLRSPWAPRHG